MVKCFTRRTANAAASELMLWPLPPTTTRTNETSKRMEHVERWLKMQIQSSMPCLNGKRVWTRRTSPELSFSPERECVCVCDPNRNVHMRSVDGGAIIVYERSHKSDREARFWFFIPSNINIAHIVSIAYSTLISFYSVLQKIKIFCFFSDFSSFFFLLDGVSARTCVSCDYCVFLRLCVCVSALQNGKSISPKIIIVEYWTCVFSDFGIRLKYVRNAWYKLC